MTNRQQVINHVKLGYRTGKPKITVWVGKSNRIQNTLEVLEQEGYILGWKRHNHPHHPDIAKVVVYRRYVDGVPALSKVMTVRSAGKPRTVSWRSLYTLHRGLGNWILSTSQGIMTDQAARKRRLGGQILFGVL